MAVTLPVILLLLDIYPLRRISLCPGKGARKLSVFLEKIPFFALSIVSSIITIMAQHSGGAIQSLERIPLDFRMLNGLNSLVFYLEKMVWPHELVPFYPLPKYFHPFDLQYIIPGILVLAVTGICLWMVKKGKYLLFIAWLYYVITLIPVLGIIQVGDQVAADRYTYLPSLGVFILIGAGVSWIFEKGILFKHKSIIGGLGLTFICIFIFLGQLTVKQIKLWHNSETLWSYVISAFPFPKSGPIAHYNLANAYAEKGWLDEAISAYKRALTINPNNVKAHNNLGLIHYRKGMFDDAISEYKKALVINPDLIELRCNLGVAYDKKGWLDEAISEYMRALIINPNDAKAHYILGLTYNNKGMLFEAVSEWKKVITINPNYLKAHYKLGLAYGNKGMFKEAIFHFKQVIAINPNYAVAYNNLAWIYATCQNATFRNGEEAVSLATKACELTKFNNVSLINTLAAAYAEVGNFKKAIECQNRAIDLSQKEARPALLKRLERYQSGQVYKP